MFLLLYIVLLTLSLTLLVAAVYGAITILAFTVNVYTIMAAVGLVGLGVMFFAFFIKFVFSVSRSHNPHRREITAEEQPRLFEFVKQLSEDTQAPFPRKIFLVPDVNAAVFYHSSFWSMFLPVRKNLEIGLGLVNSLSVGEFKAVLAHEFGHFSQRSMKLGSYVYTVNRALYNLVYEYDRWDQLLDEWVSAGGLFGFFAIITRGMVTAVRSLLRGAYQFVNRYYAGLSRQMEYHADLVASNVAGHEPMISALRRIELGAYAYELCTYHLNQLAERGQKSENLYANHRTVLTRLAEHYGLKVEQGLPLIPNGELAKNLVKSRITIKDQWASHPSRSERECNILTQPVAVEAYPQPAWKLFKNPVALCQEATQRLYSIGLPEQSLEALSSEEFARFLVQEEEKYRVDPVYRGFYDDRFLLLTDPTETVAENDAVELTFDMVYNEAHQRKIAEFFSDQEDFETLKHIQAGTIVVKHFEFDNQKYRKKDVGKLLRLLNSELARQKLWLTELDQQAFCLHYREARQGGATAEYLARYQTLISLQEAHQCLAESQQQIDYWQNQLGTKSHWTEQEVSELTKEMSNVEVRFKSYLRSCATTDKITATLGETQQEALTQYLNGEQTFHLKVSTFDEEGYARFVGLVLDVKQATSQAYKQSLKSLTDYQIELREAAAARSVNQLQTN